MEQQTMIKTDKPFTVFAREADIDYLLARLLNFTGSAFSSRAGYYSQQSLEKYFKALQVQAKGEYLKTHNLIQLLDYCMQFEKSFNDDFRKKVEVFNDFIDLGRYGGEASYDPHSIKTDKVITAGVVIWEDKNILLLDELVYLIRSKLDFKAVGFSDSLKAIVDNNQADYIVGTWRFPVLIKDILTTENQYFK